MMNSPGSTGRNTNQKRGILRLLKAYFSHNRIGDLLVLKGRLSPDDLDYALGLARARHHKIGQVLLDEGLIRRHELYATLGTQWSVRTIAYTTAAVVSFASLAPRQARADDGRTQYTTTQTLAYASAARMGIMDAPGAAIHRERLAHYPALFGSGEKESTDLSAFTKWTSMFERYNVEKESNGLDVTKISLPTSDTAATMSVATLARTIDAQMNRIAYVDDKENYGKSDYWATPQEFMAKGGDCEDFAIAKYMALKSVGVGDDRMRIAIVYDTVKNIPHAILVVYSEEGALILDNQSKITRKADEISRYKPIFSINQTAWWLHTKGADVQVASAAR